jgi:hypothetical protein
MALNSSYAGCRTESGFVEGDLSVGVGGMRISASQGPGGGQSPYATGISLTIVASVVMC